MLQSSLGNWSESLFKACIAASPLPPTGFCRTIAALSKVSGLTRSSWCLSVPDRHPSDVRHKHQEDQNCHPGAKRFGDRHCKRQGES